MTSRGPLGLARVCGGRLHAGLDVAVAVGLALAPIAPALRPDLLGIVGAELAAVAWLRVATLTRYRRPTVTASVTTPAGPPTTSAPVTGPGTLGRLLPGLEETLAAGARAAGRRAARHVGRLPRSWRPPPPDGGDPAP